MSTPVRAFLVTTLGALLVAAALHLLLLLGVDRVWPALIHLTLFGWITGMILTVNYHTMPVFAARDFPYPGLIVAHWATFTTGVTLAILGLISRWPVPVSIGLLLQLIAALIFVANTMLLFKRGLPRPHRPPDPSIPGQSQVDRVSTQGTRSAGMCLPLALLLLLAQHRGWIDGTWLLAAEHLLALGWIMLMIVGVAYHVLPRFSGRGVRDGAWARTQMQVHRLALVLLVPALGFGWQPVFALGALLMTVALALFAWTIWPTLVGVRRQLQPIQITAKEHPR